MQLDGRLFEWGIKKEYALSILSKWVSRTSPIILERHIKNAMTELMHTDYVSFTSQGLLNISFCDLNTRSCTECSDKAQHFGKYTFQEKHIAFRHKKINIAPISVNKAQS